MDITAFPLWSTISLSIPRGPRVVRTWGNIFHWLDNKEIRSVFCRAVYCVKIYRLLAHIDGSLANNCQSQFAIYTLFCVFVNLKVTIKEAMCILIVYFMLIACFFYTECFIEFAIVSNFIYYLQKYIFSNLLF